MSQAGDSRFRVECPQCDVQHGSDEFETAMDFVKKHRGHTQHDMEWARANFEEAIELTRTAWEVTCDICGDSWQFDEMEAAQEFRQEHKEYTDHGMANPPEEIEVDLLNGNQISRGTVKEMIRMLEERFDEGAPIEEIYAQFSDENPAIKEVKGQIESLRSSGEIYQPSQGYLRTT